MIINHPLDVEYFDVDSFLIDNKYIIKKMWKEATCLIPADDFDNQNDYFTAIAIMVSTCIYSRREEINGTITYCEEDEDGIADLAQNIMIAKVLWDLVNKGLVKETEFGKFSLTEKGLSLGGSLVNKKSKNKEKG